jgi:hypothetical protein
MTTPSPCEKCGLRTVRKELARDGIVMRFCEECYYGEAGEEAPPASTPEARMPGAERPAS